MATYTFALVHPLGDLALARGDGSGAPPTWSTAAISGRMAELCERQAALYSGGARRHDVLRHAMGNRAAMATTVVDPIGNEDQLLNPAQQGALVDLRLAEVGNFVTDPSGARWHRCVPSSL